MKYYLTTPIYYVNDSPHIGHVYTTLAADVIARFKRLDGITVHFLTGTDEHGQKVEKAATAKGYSPKEFCDEVYKRFENVAQTVNISYDDFIRTSESRHKVVVQKIWQKLFDQGDIYLGKYSGWYSIRDEAFYDESEIINGKAPSGAEVEWIEEPSYFFKLTKWQDKLLKFYDDNPDFILPHFRANEVKSFVKSGLKDLSVSRTSFLWGIKVPNDNKHIIYVWLDALFNYYSAIETKQLKNFWPPDLHIVGKDIIRFHAVYWPAFLMALKIPLPKRIFAHGWWLANGEKMSKSIGNIIDPFKLKEEFGLDYLRYYLMREMPFGNDHSYSRESFISKINSELCNNIGNLCQRVLVFIEKNSNSLVPLKSELNNQDYELLEKCYITIDFMRDHMEKQAIHLAFEEVIKLGKKVNEYVDYNAPWKLNKTDLNRMNAVLYTLLECIRNIAIMLQPLIPGSANKILDNLGINPLERAFKNLSTEYSLKCGHKLPKPNVVFPRIS